MSSHSPEDEKQEPTAEPVAAKEIGVAAASMDGIFTWVKNKEWQ